MDKPTKLALTFWACVLLALMVARLLGAQAIKVVGSYPNPSIMAATTCDSAGRPVISMRMDIADSPESATVVTHEREHIAQMRRLDLSCPAYQFLDQKSWHFRLVMEAEAFCMETDYGVARLGWNRDSTLTGYAHDLYSYYNLGLSLEAVEDTLKEICLRPP